MEPIVTDILYDTLYEKPITKPKINVEQLQNCLKSLLEDNKPLEIGYPIILQFLGAPWDRDAYIWEKPIYIGGVRRDIVTLCWIKCRLNTAITKEYPSVSVYNGDLVLAFGAPRGIRVTLFKQS
jgi:hypothetical protein